MLQVHSHGLALASRCAPLSFVCCVVANRDLVQVPADLWQATVRDLQILQKRNAARRRNGAAHRASTPGPHCAGRVGRSCQAEGGRCWLRRRSGHHRRAASQAHPALDSELARLPQAEVREMFTSYVELRGAEPSEDIERTLEKVSAVHQVSTAVLVQFADCALFPPRGPKGKLSGSVGILKIIPPVFKTHFPPVDPLPQSSLRRPVRISAHFLLLLQFRRSRSREMSPHQKVIRRSASLKVKTSCLQDSQLHATCRHCCRSHQPTT